MPPLFLIFNLIIRNGVTHDYAITNVHWFDDDDDCDGWIFFFRICARATQTPDLISGDWDALFKVGEHTSPASFKLKLDGDKVTGTAESAHTGPGTIRDGSWIDGKLSFTLDFKTHESIAITGKLQETKLVGEFTTEGFTSTWEATKKK